jgi:hypothetical protein
MNKEEKDNTILEEKIEPGAAVKNPLKSSEEQGLDTKTVQKSYFESGLKPDVQSSAEITEIEQAFTKLHHEINFASKVLNLNSSNFGNSLNESISSLKHSLTEMENLNKQINEQNTIMVNELTTFALLPEKITKNINAIIPKIANEVEKIHASSVLEVKDQFSSLHNQLNEGVVDYESKLKDLTNQIISNLSSATQRFNSSIEQKFTQFTNHLAKEADAVSERKNFRLLKYLCFVIGFSALISGITSYIVTTQFPRFVTVTGAQSLSITDSKVQVWGAKAEEMKPDVVNKTK